MNPLRIASQMRAETIQRFLPQRRLFSLRNKLPKPLRQPRSRTGRKALFAVVIFISFDDIQEYLFQVVFLAPELGYRGAAIRQDKSQQL